MSDSALPMKRPLENANEDEPIAKMQKTEIESQKPIEALKDTSVESSPLKETPSSSDPSQAEESEFMQAEAVANEAEISTETKSDEIPAKCDDLPKEVLENDNAESSTQNKAETSNSETAKNDEIEKTNEMKKGLPQNDVVEPRDELKTETITTEESEKSSQEKESEVNLETSKIETKDVEKKEEKKTEKKDENAKEDNKLLHTKANVAGNRFYVGETCLAKYPLDEFHYECTIKSIDEDAMGVEIWWFNRNPEHTKVKIDLLEKADTDTIYVGEKIWAKYTDGQLYEAKVEKINFTDSGKTESFEVTWFNDNPEHRVIKRGDVEKMTDLDFQERFEDPMLRENDERKEAVDLKKDAEMDINEVLQKEYGIKL